MLSDSVVRMYSYSYHAKEEHKWPPGTTWSGLALHGQRQVTPGVSQWASLSLFPFL